MARPKNTQLRVQIAHEAARQFREVGYNDTSYSSIAEACGISRNLVQYHWPKKELLAMAFMETVLSDSIAYLGFSEADLVDDFDCITAVGVRFFESLLESEGTRQFLVDILASRELTEGTLIFDFQWALGYVTKPIGFDAQAAQRNVVLNMGGFYDLLYWCLKHDEPLDIEVELSRVVDAFAHEIAASR